MDKSSRRKFIASSLIAGAVIPSAYDFGKEISERGHTFGIDNAGTAAALRELADRIEKRDVVLFEGGVFTIAKKEEWGETVLYLNFHERAIKK